MVLICRRFEVWPKDVATALTEQILHYLYQSFPNYPFTAEIAREIARDEEFTKTLLSLFKEYKLGDPMDPSVSIGPLAKKDIVDTLEKQINDSVAMGAKILIGGKRPEGIHNIPNIPSPDTGSAGTASVTAP